MPNRAAACIATASSAPICAGSTRANSKPKAISLARRRRLARAADAVVDAAPARCARISARLARQTSINLGSEFYGHQRKASMKTTISVIKADVGSIGGHIKPSAKLKAAIEHHVRDKGKKLLIDLYVSSTGDDTALLMSHDRGVNDPKIHELAWDAFMAGTKVA